MKTGPLEITYVFLKVCVTILLVLENPYQIKKRFFCLLISLGPQYETFTTTMLKPPRPTYTELISQLQNLDQHRNWFSNQSDVSFSQLTLHLTFYGHQQKQSQSTTPRNCNNTFTSSGRGFQAQQFQNQNQSYQDQGCQTRELTRKIVRFYELTCTYRVKLG
jgi:hypothetical protein